MKLANTKRSVFVYADWLGLKEPNLMGILHAERLRGKEIFSFEYDKNWLKSEHIQLLDPDLQLYSGLHYLKEGNRENFGVFLDSSPDRWGRILMRRREAALARFEKRQEQHLYELDYLLGVYDGHRMGALRFKSVHGEAFLNNNKELASPPWTSIGELENISLQLESDDAVNNPEYLKWLSMLINPGSSLGGARPKASITDKKGQLWIAKFPSIQDSFNIGAWEMLTHELAVESGINMAEAKAQRFSSKHDTFLTKRFDRGHGGSRIHFASAMTLLGYSDGEKGASYLDMVEFIINYGGRVTEDLEQLFRRITFSICVSNVDDHLRNHGFLLTRNGWVLSPAYDINPIETGTGLSLNISENENSLDWSLLMEVGPYFRLEREKVSLIIEEVKFKVKKWREKAIKYGVSNVEQELKSNAFRMAYMSI
ncbi:type II toxin-antitoxin system HipA family toxin [Aquirufa salirivi]|uniref:HipA domain-containing protein n=1 Tax=Aquirufa salirivi TaxID=3104729 RepID=A0ABW8RVN0_9BACT